MDKGSPVVPVARFRVSPGRPLRLDRLATRPENDSMKPSVEREMPALFERMSRLQERLYAQGTHALLIVLQGMDTSGKDSTIRRVFGAFDPLGCEVTGFKAPSVEEQSHDFLWRIHHRVPPAGTIGIFNRSHYESVLVERVKRLAPPARLKRRYEHINQFERMLHDEGVTVVKLFLHISKAYQKRQLEARLADPRKHWKFNPGDLAERGRWDRYMAAYGDALRRCSTPHAPWYVVPAEKKWLRDYIAARVVCDALEAINPRYPKPDFDPAAITVE